MNAPVTQVVFYFYDKEGNKGTTTLYCSFSLSGDALLYLINLMADYMQALSNASLRSVTTYHKIELQPYSYSLGEQDLSSRVRLFYSEGDTYETIDIPAPKATLWESEGEYANIRVDPLSLEMVTWFSGWDDFQGHITTKEGEAFPSTFRVGGKAL